MSRVSRYKSGPPDENTLLRALDDIDLFVAHEDASLLFVEYLKRLGWDHPLTRTTHATAVRASDEIARRGNATHEAWRVYKERRRHG